MITIGISPVKLGTIIFTVQFLTDAGLAATPKTLTWSLTNEAGTVINSRNRVSVTPAASNVIVCSGADLQLLTGETADYVHRRFIAEGTYDSTTLGDNLPVKEVAAFVLENNPFIT